MPQPVAISLLLKTASNLKYTHSRADQIRYLRLVYNEPLRYIIQGALHPGVEWLLPKQFPLAYTKTNDPDTAGKLYREYKKLYVFCKGGSDKLDQQKRENLFIQLLEAVHPDDAELLIAMKNKTLPYKGLDYELFCEAFPGMLPVNEKITVKDNGEPPTVELSKTETFVEETPAPKAKREGANKGKGWFNDGLKSFLISKEEASLKGLFSGRLKA